VSLIANPLYGLPLTLYGIGIAFIFSGIVWVLLTRRAQPLRISSSAAKGISGSASAREEFKDLAKFGPENDTSLEGRTPRRGVGAIFTSDEAGRASRVEASRTRLVSRRFLLDIVEWSLFMVFYAGLVQEYISNVYLQLWVRRNFPIAQYFLNDYAVLVVTMTVGVLVIAPLLRKWRLRNIRESE